MIYVLGGAGFVGSAFARRLAARGEPHQVITRENYDAFVGTRCRVLVNANGNSRKYLATDDPALDFDLSVRSVMGSLHDFDADAYVLISSVAVYPDASSPAASREDADRDPLAASPYGFHKHLAEQLVRRYARDWLIVRLGGVVGPGMKKGPIYDLLTGDPLRVGQRSRFQYIGTDAFAECVLALLDGGHTRDVFNVTGRGSLALDAVPALAPYVVPNDLPVETWDVSVEKVGALLELPTTEHTIREFVEQWQRETGRE